MVGRESRVTEATSEMSPYPRERASQAAQHRRALSWSEVPSVFLARTVPAQVHLNRHGRRNLIIGNDSRVARVDPTEACSRTVCNEDAGDALASHPNSLLNRVGIPQSFPLPPA